MKKTGLWILSIFLGLLAIMGLCIPQQAWGTIFFVIPAVLFNPKFREFAESKKLDIKKPIAIMAVILPLITTMVSAATSPQSVQSAATSSQISSVSSQVVSQATSSQASASSKTGSISSVTPAPKSNAKLKIHYLDVGQGDSEFVELPNGQCMLIDAGIPEQGPNVVNNIKNLGHSKIDYIICTHPHADHIGGMTDVINSFNIGSIYMPRTSDSDTPTTKVYRNLLAAIQSKGLSIHTAKAGTNIINSGNLSVNLIAPCGTGYHDLNQYSAVMMLQYGENKFLFMGDAGGPSEEQITADVSADVLKVGHHGSNTASTQVFLNKVHPKYAVIEVGMGNSYGHPTAATLSKLQNIGATIYRTDNDGTIIFTSDSKTITVDKKASSIQQNAPPTTHRSSGSTAKQTIIAPTPKNEAPANDKQNETVYITRTGKKYHRGGCRYLRRSKYSISLKDAKAEGYTPCSVCHPPE